MSHNFNRMYGFTDVIKSMFYAHLEIEYSFIIIINYIGLKNIDRNDFIQ